jgi:alkylhydroperoxidase family enzyme
MARIPYPDPAESPERVREALAALPPLNIFRMLSHAETAFRPFLRFGGAVLGELALDPGLRELAILEVAAKTGARYEWIQHVEIAKAVGITDQQIAAVERDELDSDSLSPIVETPRVSDDTFAAVSDSLSPREIVELLLTAGEYLMLARVMTTLELEIDDAVGRQVLDAGR